MECLWGIDPCRTLMDMIPEPAARLPFPVHLMAGSGGCHLNRPIAALIEDSGFSIRRLDTGYVSPIRITGFHYQGTAEIH